MCTVDWVSANITPVFKKGNKQLVSNYRPISLTCIIVKVLERIIFDKFYELLESHKILSDAQFGFGYLIVWSQVQNEPIVCEESHDDLSSGDTLVTDLRVRGVWQPQVDALFDVRVVDTDVPSYQGRTPQAVLHAAETEK